MKRIILLIVSIAFIVFIFNSCSNRIESEKYSWETAYAKVLETGDLEWAPEPFVFEKGESIRYIDYESGDDNSDGLTESTPWKHHPWDALSAGKSKACSGIITYVFKRGVVYRGSLAGNESGKKDNPIRLTSDPDWGSGEASIYGSEPVKNWTRGTDHEMIPDGSTVWYADLDYSPRNCWTVGEREVVRLKLSRTPNWNVSNPDDIKSEWWTWENPEWWKDGGHTVEGKEGKVHLGIDTKNLTEGSDYYEGGIVWTEWGIVMGTPFPSMIETYDEAQKGIGFQGVWKRQSGKIITKNRYYLEDKPQYLDEEGEFWFEKEGRGGRLFLRLPENTDPNNLQIEAARHINLIDSKGMSFVEISGLSFRFTNMLWDYTSRSNEHVDVDGACIRMYGSSEELVVKNCNFSHVNKAIRIKAISDSDVIGNIIISDNNIRYTDHGAIDVEDCSRWARKNPPFSIVKNVKVLRNNLNNIGIRPIRGGHGHAVTVKFSEISEIAGNILDRCYGAGLWIWGGKEKGGDTREVPFVRILIHHNKVTDPLLNTNDWGGIETWQGGPTYVYNNISGNPGGYWHWNFNPEKGNGRFGFAYYLDGAFKNYHFNNIAWGRSSDPSSPLGNAAAFQEIHGFQNTIFNNTVYNFVSGSRRQAPQAGRNKYIGNVWQDIGAWTFLHAKAAGSLAEGNAADVGEQKEHFAYESNAYSKNIFHNISDKFAVFEPSGRWHEDLSSFQYALSGHSALTSEVGDISENSPFINPEEHDFRLKENSAPIDGGAKVFVPWGLYADCGEWNFYQSKYDASTIMDEHWNMTAYYINRTNYYKTPRHSLIAINIEESDYVDGELEDWTKGALTLNGIDQYCVLQDSNIKDFEINDGNDSKTFRRKSIPSPNPGKGNFLIELYFKTQEGIGTLISKYDNVGYEISMNNDGSVSFMVSDSNVINEMVSNRPNINDGNWHHLVAEIDRGEKKLRLYIDGQLDGEGDFSVSDGTTLSNNADFFVGQGSRGPIPCTIDFLRVARGTLADSHTTVEELFKWQFDGPFLKDFTGRNIDDGKRDAGAMEYIE